jgi:branched-chain amino acid transport system permease protein
MVILGGMGNIWGVAAGAFIVYVIQAVFLHQLNGITAGIPFLKGINFLDYQFLLYGIVLVVMMLFRPEGLFPSQRRRQELHIAEEFADVEEEEVVDTAGVTGSMGETPGSDEIR